MTGRGCPLGEYVDVTGNIHAVLDRLRDTALDERDKGDKFERLIQAYLRSDPEWTSRFTEVWRWADWPGRAGRPDTGIDLVATNADGGLTAIQCKFYAPSAIVAKGDIDSFISASAGEQFAGRIVFDTAASWSTNAQGTIEQGVAQRVDVGYLDAAAIDWGQYDGLTPEVVVPTGKKVLRPHQQRALDDVCAGLGVHDRGQLIMACGTGKTFTSLRIAEALAGPRKTVLFCVPSIQLMSQSLREWMANAEVDIRAFAVCSDVRVGRRGDDTDQLPVDLTEPASTSAEKLLARFASAGQYTPDRMRVVFCTYQSIDVVRQAQAQGLPGFDLIICDEAHRTTGVTLAGSKESDFVRVHDNTVVAAAKRLYMTATPRVFGDEAQRKAKDVEAVLADMGDEAVFGPELHRLGFGQAVEADLLTDYKVLVLAVDQEYVAENFQQAMAHSGEIQLDQAAKLIGCWNGLAKNFGPTKDGGTPSPGTAAPMRTAVAFAQHIRASKAAAAAFPDLADRALIDAPEGRPQLKIQAAHVDGTMGVHERNAWLAWLKAPAPDGVCRVLTNAKCLSEGVDVPALDAVLFLTPRSSQVDVVQSVGRVMRKAPGKELGYIVLPVVVPSGIAPDEALRDNDRYKVVWQVLQALRSHDDRFQATVNQIELNKRKPDAIEIVSVTGPADAADGASATAADPIETVPKSAEQLLMEFPVHAFRDAMYARIVEKVGERRYWESWAKDIAAIAEAHQTRIRGLITSGGTAAIEFERFLAGLRGNLNDTVTGNQAIEMLAQHLITRPVFEALFDESGFLEGNPVAQAMQRMLSILDEHALAAEHQTLEGFYESVRRRVAGIDNAAGKQRVLTELYEKFFATAFPKTVAKLGIVYTPVEIVDFMLRSADDVLRSEFGHGLTDQGVHVLDPFTGTGTFMVRLLQSGLVTSHDLARKYAEELHANEILLLPYYIAAANIETTYEELSGSASPFPGLVLTDSFQSWEDEDNPDLDIIPENNNRLAKQKQLTIQVIVGNPPYSKGRKSANDDNTKADYPILDAAIRETYAARSTAKQKASLYDSYIRAIKWATLRIKERGIVAFVTNSGFLDSNGADGMRLTLAEEFGAIYVYNLRGKQLDSDWKAEGGKVFGSGSKAGVAITILVKDNTRTRMGSIQYIETPDFATADQKLAELDATGSIMRATTTKLLPNGHGDWLVPRQEIADESLSIEEVFDLASGGLKTNRDPWNYNFSRYVLEANVKRTLAFYNDQVLAVSRGAVPSNDPKQISWDRVPSKDVARGVNYYYNPDSIQQAAYRPFCTQMCYSDRRWNNTVYQVPQLFPPTGSRALANYGLTLTAPASHHEFGVLATNRLPDYHLLDTGKFFARWRYEQVDDGGMFDPRQGVDVVDGFLRIDNVSDAALTAFRASYPDEVIYKDDVFDYVYGVLHSPEYREAYGGDLKRVLPRIPFAADFRAFSSAGRRLVELHIGYENVQPYPLEGLDVAGPGGDADYRFFSVGDKKMAFGRPLPERASVGQKHDRSKIHYNDNVTLSNIPQSAYRYILGNRSAVEWVMDRYWVKTDKASGIVNDPNDWSRAVGNPRYIIDLLARIVTVSLQTTEIMDALPPLNILSGDMRS